MTQAPNPFAPPKSAVLTSSFTDVASANAWRDEKVLIVPVAGVDLPGRCLKCNQPTSIKVKRTLQWHTPFIYALLFSPILYIIVAMIVRKTVKLELPLCEAHDKKRKQGVMLAWGSVLLGFLLGVIGAAADAPGVMLVGMLAFLVLLVVGIMKMAILQPTKIDKTHLYAKGASDEFLATLPVWPGAR